VECERGGIVLLGGRHKQRRRLVNGGIYSLACVDGDVPLLRRDMGGMGILVQLNAVWGIDQPQFLGREGPVLLGCAATGVGALQFVVPGQYLGGMWGQLRKCRWSRLMLEL